MEKRREKTDFQNFIYNYMEKQNVTAMELSKLVGYKRQSIEHLLKQKTTYPTQKKFRNKLLELNLIDSDLLKTLDNIITPKYKFDLTYVLLDIQEYLGCLGKKLAPILGIPQTTLYKIFHGKVNRVRYNIAVKILLNNSQIPEYLKEDVIKASQKDSKKLEHEYKKRKIIEKESILLSFIKEICSSRAITISYMANLIGISKQVVHVNIESPTYYWYVKYIDIWAKELNFTEKELLKVNEVESELSKPYTDLQKWVIKYTAKHNITLEDISKQLRMETNAFYKTIRGEYPIKNTIKLIKKIDKKLKITDKERFTLLNILLDKSSFKIDSKLLKNKRKEIVFHINDKYNLNLNQEEIKNILDFGKVSKHNKTRLPYKEFRKIREMLKLEPTVLMSSNITEIIEHRLKQYFNN